MSELAPSVEDAVPSHRRNWLSMLLVAVVLVAGGTAAWHFASGKKHIYHYKTVKVKRGGLTALVMATGTLQSTTTVTVGSQVSGPVEQVLVDFNSRVKRGQVLARIDPSEFKAQLGQATAGLEAARAGLLKARASLSNAAASIAQAKAGIASARASLSQTRAAVDSATAGVRDAASNVIKAKAQMDNALVQFQRSEKLYKRQLIAASDLDTARTTYRVDAAAYQTSLAAKDEAVATHRQALAKVQAAQSDVQSAVTREQAAAAQYKSAQAGVASARATVSQARATRDQAAVNVQRTAIRSPINGVVIDREVDVGQTVAAAFEAPKLFVIAKDLSHMQVLADVSEADIGGVKKGQKVTFTVDAYPFRTFSGKVIQVRSASQQGTNSQGQSTNVVVYGVLVDAPNKDLLLKPGMTATVTIYTEHKSKVILVPNAALRFVPPKSPGKHAAAAGQHHSKPAKKSHVKGLKGTVWVDTSTGLKRRDLILGITDGNVTEVRQGQLKPGDKVVVSVTNPEARKHHGLMLSF